MFLGHYAVALAAKRFAPTTSLGTLFFASVFIDLLWPTLLLAGVERARIDPASAGLSPLVFEHYPVSHSLLAVAGWAMLLGVAYFAAIRRWRGALVVAALVLSHWLLDVLVHRPDLLPVPGGQVAIGAGLWNVPLLSALLELTLFGAGLVLYLRATPASTRRWPLWTLCLFLLIIFAADALGPPPPSMAAVAWAGQAQWLLVCAGFWVDRVTARSMALTV